MIKLTPIILSSSLLLASSFASACDNKSCEIAYLNSSEQYASLQNSHALAAQQEREAYAKIRENRQKKINEQLVREARANLIRIINKAIAQGKSMEFIEAAVKEAYANGTIKAEVGLLKGNNENTANVEAKATEVNQQNS